VRVRTKSFIAAAFLLFLLLLPVRTSLAATAETDAQAEAKARAYYYFTLGHYYEELAGPFRRSAYLREAIEQYKKALQYDPNSTQIVIQLAEAYRTNGSIRDAVVETRQLLEKDPDNLAAHRLLARIYFQTLGELDSSSTTKDTLRLAIEQYQEITRLAPDDTDAWLMLARLRRMSNDSEGTEAALKEVLAREPYSEIALATLAALYTERGEHDKATKLLEDATAHVSSARLFGALGYAYEQSDQTDKAIEAYRRALSQDNEKVEIRRRLAEALLRADRYDEALTEYKALAEANPEDADAYLRLSQIYRQQHRYADAHAAIEEAKKAAPDNLEVNFNEAVLYEVEGNYDGALAVLSELLSRVTSPSGEYTDQEKRTRGIVLERLGATYRQAENYDQAVKSFEMMLSLDEDTARRGYAQIGETYRQSREYDKGIAILRQGRERFPDDRDLTTQLAMLFSESGDLASAVHLLQGLADTAKDDADARQVQMALAQVYEHSKKWPEAEAAIAQAEKLSSNDTDLQYVYFLRGAVYERQKLYDKAEAEFRKVLALNPDSAITLNYLGYMLADNNTKLQEALTLLKHAVELEPTNGAYLDSLGWAYYRLDNLEQAEKYLVEASERLSREATIHDHLGDLYYKTGRLHQAEQAWERAREEWQRAPASEFDAEAFARLEQKLQELKLRLAQETKSPKKTQE
jgi:tetratricopeptide (TPR) repeat protein